MTFIAGLRGDGLTAPWVIEGAMDGDAFEQYIKKQRAPTLQKGAVVVPGNLPADKRDGARRAVEKRGAWLLFLPNHACCLPIRAFLFTGVGGFFKKLILRARNQSLIVEVGAITW